MFKILPLAIIFIATLSYHSLHAQHSKCATMHILNQRMLEYPDLKQQMQMNELEIQKWISTNASGTSNQIIKIPIVFHVIWHDSIENVSDQQIFSQLDVLNADYGLKNKDSLLSQHPFHKFIGNAGIEFCLATIDPNGNPTNGITRTYTSVTSWLENTLDDIKSTTNGGHDNWPPERYLNIYCVNMQGETLGFSSFPDELSKAPKKDGVVIRYEAFGTVGTAGMKGFETNNKGRTATHEVGHWLNLIHIWGDEMCGDDKVADTAPAEDENKFCPKFPQRPNNKCGSDANGEMYMNFMDYVEDSCMAMFTRGQADRMLAAINMFRSALLNNNGCMVTSIQEKSKMSYEFTLKPNPNNGFFTCRVNLSGISNGTISIYNSLGAIVRKVDSVYSGEYEMDCSNLQAGFYFLKLETKAGSCIRKVVLNRS